MPALTAEHQSKIIADLSTPTGGIVNLKLSCWERIIRFLFRAFGLTYFNANLRRVKEFCPDQPSFYIDKDSWKLLIEGISKNNDGKFKSWVCDEYKDFQVFGFVFCVCEPESGQITEPKILSSLPYGKFFYFRIRTILRSGTKIIVDTNNIAYTWSHNNIAASGNSEVRQNLKFVEEAGDNKNLLIEKINSQVINKKDSDFIDGDLISNIKSDFSANSKRPLSKDGNYFSRRRIETILGSHSGTEVFIGLTDNTLDSQEENHFTFQFKINPEYETSLPCPVPVVC